MRDAVAAGRRRHRGGERHGRGSPHVVLLDVSEARGRGQRDGAKRQIGIRDVEVFEDFRERAAQIGRLIARRQPPAARKAG